jgi:predicted amidohydrolase
MKIGVAQVRLESSVEGNKKKILECIGEAAGQGVEVLNFPETALSGYVFEEFSRLDYTEVDDAMKEIAGVLQGGSLHVVLGTPMREDGKLYNSAVVLFPDGKRLFYHKIHLVSYEQKYFTPGSRKVTFKVKGTGFGVMICRDQNSPELARELSGLGVKGIFISSAHYYEVIESRMKIEKNIALPIARAYENGLYVFKSNAVGTLKHMVSYGNSMIIDPRGIVVQKGGDTAEELLVYDIDFSWENPKW